MTSTTTAYAETNSNGFEITTCGRCGGSGHYSYNSVDGTRCYGCGGSGKVFTARGAAANAHYIESQKRAASEIKVGEFIWDDAWGMKARWMPVTAIDPTGAGCTINGQPTISLHTKRGSFGMFPTSMVRSVRDEAHRQELLAAARAYQDTLGKSGKPLKKTAKAAA